MANLKPKIQLLPDDQDHLVCFCNTVSYNQILNAIADGNMTFEALQGATRCSTGCGGCTDEVLAILKACVESE
ncbi:MAG: (2Fe-2S)-binding protein [Bdellovibrionaceae bacterium]|nr:(2Fe-2S)-binding protein [Pseudobdellovibrionaceae bacterium]|tara:strand:+ start:705 stop:923 length:219 start_codon:yes stop_codon:yes gene_type:complete